MIEGICESQGVVLVEDQGRNNNAITAKNQIEVEGGRASM